MELIVDRMIFERFPGMRIVGVVADGLDNTTADEDIDRGWNAAWEASREAIVYGNAQSHPLVRPWREAFRAMGVSPKQFPSSIEALLRRAMKGGEPFHINPLVDVYNAISLKHVVPAGGFDMDAFTGPLELRLTRPGDTFLSLDADTPLAVDAGEVAYAAGSTILTRHFVWRQSREALIAPETTRAVLLAEVIAEAGAATAAAVLDDFTYLLRTYFGADSQPFTVDEDTMSVSVG